MWIRSYVWFYYSLLLFQLYMYLCLLNNLALGVLNLEEDMSQGEKWLSGVESDEVIHDNTKVFIRMLQA